MDAFELDTVPLKINRRASWICSIVSKRSFIMGISFALLCGIGLGLLTSMTAFVNNGTADNNIEGGPQQQRLDSLDTKEIFRNFLQGLGNLSARTDSVCCKAMENITTTILARLVQDQTHKLQQSLDEKTAQIREHVEESSRAQKLAQAQIGKLSKLLDEKTAQIREEVEGSGSPPLSKDELLSETIPTDFIYIQLPHQQNPNSLWPTFRWEDVTSQYSGLFFRAEGSGSSSFGVVQEQESPRLTKIEGQVFSGGEGNNGELNVPYGEWSNYKDSGKTYNAQGDSYFTLRFLVSAVENRPRNTAIKIWKRL